MSDEVGEQGGVKDIFNATANDVKTYLNHKEDTQKAVIALCSVNSLCLSLDSMASSFSVGSKLDQVKNWLKILSSALHRLIAQYITLKNWSISGDLAGSFLGLASGTVGLQLTFGK